MFGCFYDFSLFANISKCGIVSFSGAIVSFPAPIVSFSAAIVTFSAPIVTYPTAIVTFPLKLSRSTRCPADSALLMRQHRVRENFRRILAGKARHALTTCLPVKRAINRLDHATWTQERQRIRTDNLAHLLYRMR